MSKKLKKLKKVKKIMKKWPKDQIEPTDMSAEFIAMLRISEVLDGGGNNAKK